MGAESEETTLSKKAVITEIGNIIDKFNGDKKQ
jgi:hypothetical protein